MRFFDRRVLIAGALALTVASCSKGGTGGSAVTAEDMTLGSADAKITLVEYASASCSHCAAWSQDVFPEFKKKYVDTGEVRYVMREFLTPPVEVAAAGFLTARCAGKDKYFTVLDAVYKGQQEMFSTGDFRGVLLRIAQSAGMTEAQFDACVSDEKSLKDLNDRVEKYSRDAKITSTPSFVLNGKLIGEGELPIAKIDAEVAAAKAALK
ncbi:MAG: thioredoxin domain-containing protein [Caulobacter sp.]